MRVLVRRHRDCPSLFLVAVLTLSRAGLQMLLKNVAQCTEIDILLSGTASGYRWVIAITLFAVLPEVAPAAILSRTLDSGVFIFNSLRLVVEEGSEATSVDAIIANSISLPKNRRGGL